MLHNLSWLERVKLMGLLFLHGMATAAWFVPLATVLDAHGLGGIKPFAFAASAMASLISPLFFGAMADRSLPPTLIFRWVSAASSCAVVLVGLALHRGAPPWVTLALIQITSLCFAPTVSLSGSIVLSQLADSGRQFGSIRAWGTLGWIAGCWTVSLLHADTTPLAFYASGLIWLILAAYTGLLPTRPPLAASNTRMTVRERMGLDALGLLRHPDHRVVFLTTALFAIPLAAFYPFTPPHLRDLGLVRTSAWMSIGQISEVAAMMGLALVMTRWRFKWAIAIGLAFGFLRYAFYCMNDRTWVLAGISLHGIAYTFAFIVPQVYLAQRVDPAWRTRAQALLSLMTGGVGNLVGFLGTGAWFGICQTPAGADWVQFWAGLAIVVAGVGVYFLSVYKGQAGQTTGKGTGAAPPR